MQVRILSPAHHDNVTKNMIAKPSRRKKKTGPKPDRVKIDKPWENAVNDALKKKRPRDGWPKEPEK